MPRTVPTQIAKYRVLELIGEGAMGIVYRAEDTVLNRVVAVKVMSESIAREAGLRDRFLREAQLAGSLSHPNVVTVYDFGETEGHLYIAMEYVPGVDLEALLRRAEPLALQTKLDLIVDVLTGLAYAHARDIVHRDVKPANIRVTEDFRAKLMDFGVAHLASSTITRTGEQMGTPSYMAPEQVTGGRVTPAADLFAAGAVLYELIAGCKPFGGPTLHAVMFKIVSEDPPPLAEVVPGISPSLERVVRKALAKDVADRYQSALDMAQDLTAERSTLSGGRVPGTLSLRPRGLAARRARSRGFLPLAIGLLAGGGAVAWALSTRPPAPRPPTSPTQGPSHGTPSIAAPSPVVARVVPDPRSMAPDSTPNAAPDATPDAPSPPRPAVRPAPRVAERAVAPPRQPTAPSVLAAPPNDPAPRPTPTETAPPPVVVADAPVGDPGPPPPPAATAVVPSVAAADPARIPDAIAAYTRAIEARDLAALRVAYPGLTVAQERSFAQFFDATRTMKVALSVAALDALGSTAELRLVGSYEFVTTAGRTERQPVSLRASLRHDGTRWRLTSVR